MSADSRNTQGGTQTALPVAWDAWFDAQSSSPRPAALALVAPAAESRGQAEGKTLPCPGPAGLWPCALEYAHEGDHLRLTREDVLAGVRQLREERDQLRRVLTVVYPLLADVSQVRGAFLRRGVLAQIKELVPGVRA